MKPVSAYGLGAVTLFPAFQSVRRGPAPAILQSPVPSGSPEAARRLFGVPKPIGGTPTGSCLRERGIGETPDMIALLR